jgi:hypothetical protein
MWSSSAADLTGRIKAAKIADVNYLPSPSVDISISLGKQQTKSRNRRASVARGRRERKFQRQELEGAAKHALVPPTVVSLLPWVKEAMDEGDEDAEMQNVLSELESFFGALPDGGPKPKPQRKRQRPFSDSSSQQNSLWLEASHTRKVGSCLGTNLTAGTTADPLGVGGFRQGFFGANPSGTSFASRSFGAQAMESTKLSLDPASSRTIWQGVVKDKSKGRWSRPPAKIDLSVGDTRQTGPVGSSLGHSEHTLCKFKSDTPSTQKISAARLIACKGGTDRNLAPDSYGARLADTTFDNASAGINKRLLKISPPITKNLQDTYSMPAYMVSAFTSLHSGFAPSHTDSVADLLLSEYSHFQQGLQRDEIWCSAPPDAAVPTATS